jgi:hypothetical protein
MDGWMNVMDWWIDKSWIDGWIDALMEGWKMDGMDDGYIN